ncbi:MAG: 50S ribosomal protein L29 [bacterium]|nr:50S ribosomal protein L29 [bacterium]MDN5835192.1 50S ribosomal protein L29 [bacterium]
MATAKQTKKTVAATEVKSTDKLVKELAQKEADLIASRRSHKAGELVNPKVLNTTRKDIARLKTAIRADEITSKKESK